MSQLPSENTAQRQNDDGLQKPAKQKRERKTGEAEARAQDRREAPRPLRHRICHPEWRSREMGEVAKWAKSQADDQFRTLEGQIAYCVRFTMDKEFANG
jgi:hypothetical protein